MSEALLNRLDVAVGRLLERNHRLTNECQQLKAEKAAWQQERAELLAEVEQILQRLDGLELEDS
jgi:FtsZ-binding cell division protein ZapB